jgi:CCR4-NOT transcription complex subunit 7/8
MPPQPVNRFPSGPPALQQQYPQQFSSHAAQGHTASHQSQGLAASAYLPGTQMGGGFGGANGLGALGAAGLNAGATQYGMGLGDQTGLNSHAARMGFAHGAQMQQQQHLHQQSHGMGDHGGRQGGASKGRIRDVWKHNLQEEMAIIRELIDDYPYVAMVC